MGFFTRKQKPKIYKREAKFRVIDSKGNSYSEYVTLKERMLWAFNEWHILNDEFLFESMVKEKFYELSKGFISNNRFILARDIVSIELISRTTEEITE